MPPSTTSDKTAKLSREPRASLTHKRFIGNALARLVGSLWFVGRENRIAELTMSEVALAKRQLSEILKVSWRSNRLLDVGCGQLLRHALVFGMTNDVVGIDIHLRFRPPYIVDGVRCSRTMGVGCAARTMIRQLLGVDRRLRRALAARNGSPAGATVEEHLMDAVELRFPDNSFDGAYSFSVFQHLPDPLQAAQEIHRVLKPGGVAYVRLHLYTSPKGSNHPMLRVAPDRYPAWAHLRPSTPYYRRHGRFVNCLRLHEWRTLFEHSFSEVHFTGEPGETKRVRRLLTDEIRAELSDYCEDELLTTTLIVLCRK